MKNFFLKQVSTLLFVSCMVITANAQFNNVLNKVKQTANDKINSAFETKPKNVPSNPGTNGNNKIKINSAFDFVACDSLVFKDNFSSYETGKMPLTWKTNGSGQVVTSPNLNGKWLQLQNFASYKLTKLIKYPSKFTIEFDIVAVADKIDDLSPLGFGFAKDNSVRSYIPDAYNDGAINNISITYYNKHGTIEASSDTKYNHADDKLDLQDYPNQIMHVSIAVDGENEQVYLDKNKISDTKMFNPDRIKYFYISAPIQAQHDAKILFGNYKMNACKK